MVERHPLRYPWHQRFPDARQVAGFEGGAVYEAEGEGAYWLIKDEGTMADFLDPEEDAGLLASLVSLERYADRAARCRSGRDAPATGRSPTGRLRAAMPSQPNDPAREGERLYTAAAELAGPRPTALADEGGLTIKETAHLQRTYRKALEDVAAQATPPPAVSPRLAHGLKHEWPKLGNFDISLAWGGVEVFGELKSGETELTLSACGWDAAKEAFCLNHGFGIAMLLVAAAPVALWDPPGVGIELLFDGDWTWPTSANATRPGSAPGSATATCLTTSTGVCALSRSAAATRFASATSGGLLGISRVEPVDEERMDWVPFLARPAT